MVTNLLVTWHIWTYSCLLVLSVVSAESTEPTEKVTSPMKVRDVNKTISKVEAILKKNPNLPRLTRGEILSLLDNITKADSEKKKQQALNAITDGKIRTEYERALMVVLPFQANANINSSAELQNLYTRSPITKLIMDDVTTERIQTTTKRNRRKNQSRRKPSMKEQPIVVPDMLPAQEQRPVYVHKTRRKPTTTTTTSTEIPTTTTENNWKPYTGMELRNPQPFGFHNTNIKTYNENTDINIPNQMKQTLMDFGIPKNHKPDPIFVTPQDTPSTSKPPTKTTPSTTTTTTSKSTNQIIPDISLAVQSLTPEMRNLLISFGLINADGTPVSQTARSTTVSPPSVFEYKPINPTVDPSSYINFKPLPSSKDAQKGYANMNNEMKSFLASYGLISDTPNNYRTQKALNSTATTETIRQLETTTQFSISNINTDILNNDMKNVLENLGLMKTSHRHSKGHIFNPAAHSADLLNHSDETDKINKLLGTIKQLKEAEKNNSLSDDEITAKFENITASLITEEDPNEESTELVQTDGSELTFEGYEPAEEELLKLQNGITDEDLEDVDSSSNFGNEIAYKEDSAKQSESENQNKSKTLQQTFDAPDPLSLEELTQIHQSYKNEVKRQQPNESSTASSSDSSAESATDETTTESSSTAPRDSSPSLTDLADSFGGDNPTTGRPNGLYFLVDWNTFLRVGTDNRTVDLNFAPKVGDPKNFLPVNVP